MARVKFYRGKQATYLADPTKFTDGLFFAKDKHLMYTGDGTAYGFDFENITAIKGIDLTKGVLTIEYINGKTPNKVITLNDHVILDGNSLSKSLTGLKADLSVVKLAQASGDNYSASYQLQDSKGTVYGATINILKDQHISKVELTVIPDTKDEEDNYIYGDHGSEALAITWILASGEEETTYINLESFLQEAEAGDGIELVNHSYKIKLDSANESEFLTLSGNGLKLSGVRNAIESANKTLKNITYEELVDLKEEGKLVSGLRYRIIDYVTTTKTSEYYKSIGQAFDVIVTALSGDTLSEDAKCALHAGDTYFSKENISSWKIKYCLENDTDRFDWADGTNGKGVIYGMEDEKGIKLGYDFHNIQFTRWKVTDVPSNSAFEYFNEGETKNMPIPIGSLNSLIGKYIAYDKTITLPCTLTVSPGECKWFFTFSYWTTEDMAEIKDASLVANAVGLNKVTVRDVEIGKEGHHTKVTLGNNVFGQYIQADASETYDSFLCATDIKIACGENNTFSHTYSIHASHGFKRNIIGHLYQCGIGEMFEDNMINTWVGGFWKNTIGAGFKGNIISDGLIYGNMIGTDVVSNLINVSSTSTKVHDNTFESGVSNNIIKSSGDIYGNTIGAGSKYNNLSTVGMEGNYFGTGFTSNLIGSCGAFKDNFFETGNTRNNWDCNDFAVESNRFESGMTGCTLDLGGKWKENTTGQGMNLIGLTTTAEVKGAVIRLKNSSSTTKSYALTATGTLLDPTKVDNVVVRNAGDSVLMTVEDSDGDRTSVKWNGTENKWTEVPRGLTTAEMNELKAIFLNNE